MAKLEIISELDAPYENLPGVRIRDQYAKNQTCQSYWQSQEMLEYVPGINGFSDDGIGNSHEAFEQGLNPR